MSVDEEITQQEISDNQSYSNITQVLIKKKKEKKEKYIFFGSTHK